MFDVVALGLNVGSWLERNQATVTLREGRDAGALDEPHTGLIRSANTEKQCAIVQWLSHFPEDPPHDNEINLDQAATYRFG